MSKQVVEVIYGKYRILRVYSESGFFGMKFHVRSDDGKVSATFDRLDRAVDWARNRAAV